MTRRDALEKLRAGALLALGLWPGALRARETSGSGSFRFLVINDTHYMSPECGQWLEGVVLKMKSEQAEFCLHAGDLTEHGRRSHLAAVRDLFKRLGIPVYVQIGNHDYFAQTDRWGYTSIFPRSINYWFEHRGWQFVALDTTEGLHFEKTKTQPATFRWMEDHLSKLDKHRPTVVFTHFPLGLDVRYRPSNADDLLDRFRPFNLRAVFSGHFHGFTERHVGEITLTTNRCCALKRANHDGTKEKGYFVCDVRDGVISRTFVQYPG